MIYLWIYLLSIVVTWGLLKLSIIIEKELAPIPFGIVVAIFVPFLNLIVGSVVIGGSIYFAIDRINKNEEFKDKIVKFFRLN